MNSEQQQEQEQDFSLNYLVAIEMKVNDKISLISSLLIYVDENPSCLPVDCEELNRSFLTRDDICEFLNGLFYDLEEENQLYEEEEYIRQMKAEEEYLMNLDPILQQDIWINRQIDMNESDSSDSDSSDSDSSDSDDE